MFPSLGIGHNIWFSKEKHPYVDQFPALCAYLEKHGVALPGWLKKALIEGMPWISREEFLQDKKRTQELKELLIATIPLQVSFMIERLDNHIPLILKKVTPQEKEKILYIVESMQSSLQGNYALIDYLNFKGAGLAQYDSCTDGWGLLQVLLDMPDVIKKDALLKAFTVSAATILLRRIKNSQPDYPLLQYLPGWMRRVHTYSDTKTFVDESKTVF